MLSKLEVKGDSHCLDENDATQSNVFEVVLDAVEEGVSALEENLVQTYDGKV